MTYDEWYRYKKSDQWKELKLKCLQEANYQCEYYRYNIRCNHINYLEMHHIHYPDIIQNDCISNVIILCNYHHSIEHGRYPRDDIIYKDTTLKIKYKYKTEKELLDEINKWYNPK